MKKHLSIWMMAAYILIGCGHHAHHHGHHDDGDGVEAHAHHHDHGHDHGHGFDHVISIHGHQHRPLEKSDFINEVTFACYQAEADSLEYAIVQPGTFRQVIKCSGRLMAAQGEEAMAVAPVSGIVKFRGKLTEGRSVARGDWLVTVSSRHLANGDPVKKAQVAYEATKKEYERMKPLVESGVVSQKDFNKAEQAYETARVAYESVSKNQSTDGQSVISPIGGYVKNVYVREGDYVEVGTPIASVTQNRRLSLRAEVPEKYYQYLHSIVSANFKTPYDDHVYSLEELGGKMLSFGKTSADNSFYVPVTFEFDNIGDAIPGSFVEIFLLSSPLENIISVPRQALVEEQGHYYVYLHLDAEGYRKQEVTVGADNGLSVQILSGITPGDCVVTRGAYQVKLATATNAIPAHSHHH